MSLVRINRQPAPRQLLVFAAAWTVFVGVAGGLQWLEERPNVAAACWIAAALVPAVGAVWREGLRRFYVALMLVTFPIGWVVSTVVLATLFFGVLTPIGFLLRLRRHDAMQQTDASRADSYWHRRDGAPRAASYFRQY